MKQKEFAGRAICWNPGATACLVLGSCTFALVGYGRVLESGVFATVGWRRRGATREVNGRGWKGILYMYIRSGTSRLIEFMSFLSLSRELNISINVVGYSCTPTDCPILG
jgi:hypothetical protein